MKAIKIDAENKTVTAIPLASGFENIAPAIGNGCTSFECIMNFKNEDGLYVDEEALAKLNEAKGAFMFDGFSGIIIGNAIIIGHNKDNNPVEFKTPIEEIQKKVTFVNIDEVRKKK